MDRFTRDTGCRMLVSNVLDLGSTAGLAGDDRAYHSKVRHHLGTSSLLRGGYPSGQLVQLSLTSALQLEGNTTTLSIEPSTSEGLT
jgi:hypothetical protein